MKILILFLFVFPILISTASATNLWEAMMYCDEGKAQAAVDKQENIDLHDRAMEQAFGEFVLRVNTIPVEKRREPARCPEEKAMRIMDKFLKSGRKVSMLELNIVEKYRHLTKNKNKKAYLPFRKMMTESYMGTRSKEGKVEDLKGVIGSCNEHMFETLEPLVDTLSIEKKNELRIMALKSEGNSMAFGCDRIHEKLFEKITEGCLKKTLNEVQPKRANCPD